MRHDKQLPGAVEGSLSGERPGRMDMQRCPRDRHTTASPISSQTTGANYLHLQFSLFQKGFTAHQALCSAICLSLEMTSSVAFKGKKPHVSTYLRDQLASSCQADMLKGERKKPHIKIMGMADLSLENMIFQTSAAHRAVYFTAAIK